MLYTMHLESVPTVNKNTRSDAKGLQRADEYSVLLVAVRENRCQNAFRRIYEYYAPRVASFLRQKGVEDRISQEIMQETMTKVWLKADQFDSSRANASTWIYTIARNLYIDRVRQSKRRSVDINDPLLVHEALPAPDLALDVEERDTTLRAAIDELPPEQAEVLRLIYICGMKQQSVAEELSIPLNTVKSRLRLALEKLRRLMEHE